MIYSKRKASGQKVNLLLFKSEGIFMSVLYNLMNGIANAIPVLLAKIGTFFLFIFTGGMVLGYFFASLGYGYFILLVPVVSMIVMWKKLDEGALVFVALMAIAFFFPELFLA